MYNCSTLFSVSPELLLEVVVRLTVFTADCQACTWEAWEERYSNISETFSHNVQEKIFSYFRIYVLTSLLLPDITRRDEQPELTTLITPKLWESEGGRSEPQQPVNQRQEPGQWGGRRVCRVTIAGNNGNEGLARYSCASSLSEILIFCLL